MIARDVMTSQVVTAALDASVADIAQLLIKNRISAVPVVDTGGRLAGIISEADLLHRHELGTERKRSPWLRLFRGEEQAVRDFVHDRSRRAKDIMTRPVVTVDEATPLGEIANLLEARHIKRVVVADDTGRPKGVVSRSDVVRGLVAAGGLERTVSASDAEIKAQILASLTELGLPVGQAKIMVADGGVVSMWGVVQSEARKQAMTAAAESTPGVRQINDNLVVAPLRMWAD